VTLPKAWRRALQALAVIGALAIVQGQTSCEARPGARNPAPPPGSGAPNAPQPPTSPPMAPPDTTTVTGDERIAWDQEVPAGTRTAAMVYAAYVDGIRVDFPGVSCKASSETLHECLAPLPPMNNGPHIVRLSATGPSDNPLHGPRSRVLNLLKVDPGSAAATQSAAQANAARDEGPFAIDVISDSTGAIADIAVTPEGIPFIAEAAGRILTAGANGLAEALQIRDVSRRGSLGLFSIALHPDFDKNRLVYFAYAAESSSGPVWRIARGREVDGRIGEVAVLIDGEPAAPGSWAVIRFGPDRQLYAALGADPVRQVRAGGYSGKLLRLTDEGRRATNNADGSPIVDNVQGAPAGLTWAQDVRLMQTRAGARHELVISQGTATLSRYVWEAGRRPAGLAFTTANGGWLYIATLDRGLQRVKWPPKGGMAQADAALARDYTGVRAVAVAPDGTIYFGTANSASDRGRAGDAPGKNYVIRLRPR
jgi:glucose/arabinose dehydrogenase